MKEIFKKMLKNGKKKLWFSISMFFTIMYLTWRIFFTIPYEYGIVSMIVGIALLIVEILGLFESIVHYTNMCKVVEYSLPEVPEDEFPHVDVFVSTYSESVELLRKTLIACKQMEYPDKNKVHIYLCDDGRRPEMGILATELEVNYLVRDTHEGAKAGNLNHALEHTSSPYVVTFDADMIPQSKFLLQTIPYFVDAELKNRSLPEDKKIKLGIVQTPQSFYTPDLYQFHLFSEGRVPDEQDYFHRHIQVARTWSNSVIYCGSNTILSREALKAAGGFYTQAITEDFATGLLIEKKGYVSLATGKPLASGLNPDTLQNLIQQRVRWARGVIATGRKMHIYTSSDLTFAQKINYWASIVYWYVPIKRLIYLLAPILYTTFGLIVFKCTLLQALAFWLPMYISGYLCQRAFSYNVRTSKWEGIYSTALFPFLLIPVLLETFGISLKKFKVTSKERKTGKVRHPLYMVPFIILIVLSLIGLVNSIWFMVANNTFGPIIALFWLLSNLYLLAMSLFFVAGRTRYRTAERVKVEMPGILRVRGESYECFTNDMSETGISLIMKDPHYIAEGEPVQIELKTEKYHAVVDLKVVHVSQTRVNDEVVWRYAFTISDFKDSYAHILSLLYDRAPTFPEKIASDGGRFEDLRVNISKRLKTSTNGMRGYPRILVDADVTVNESGSEKYYLHDFNYKCITIKSNEAPKKLTVYLPYGDVLECTYVSDVSDYHLYYVSNHKELYRQQEDCDRIMTTMLKLAEGQKEEEKEIAMSV